MNYQLWDILTWYLEWEIDPEAAYMLYWAAPWVIIRDAGVRGMYYEDHKM